MFLKQISLLFVLFLRMEVYLNAGPSSLPLPPNDGFLGSQGCAPCHREIADVQLKSEHARTLRKANAVPELLQALPLHFSDKTNAIEYRLEKSAPSDWEVDLLALKAESSEKLELMWAFGAGRKGMTFVGRNAVGEYGQGRVSWYQRINALDITTGAEREPIRNPHDWTAQWMGQKEREECFACHLTRGLELLPEAIQENDAGIQCERCHGPGQKHVEAVTEGKSEQGLSIRNPGKFNADEQLRFCGVCHRTPLANPAEAVLDKRTVRFPAQRLVLSRCYDESEGKLKCTTCHNPHENLQESSVYYDAKCGSCHAGTNSIARRCPVSNRDCSSCHMPRVALMQHSDFADHWIRKPAVR